MKYHLLIAVALVLAPAAAMALSPAPPPKLFAAAGDVAALIAKAKAERKPGQPMVSVPILALAPYRVSLEYRPDVAPASTHEKEAELVYVVEGAGTLLEGGTLTDAKRTNDTNLSGSGIDGGTPMPLAKGDVTIIPQNTPHQMLPGGGGALVLMTMHVPGS